MEEIRPWEESADEAYWNTLMRNTKPGTGEPNAEPRPVSGWERAQSSYANGDILELRVVGNNRGGLLVDLGDTRGFVPASQLVSFQRQSKEEERMQELAHYVDRVLRLQVIELDRAHNRLILSERVANPPALHAEQILATIEPQQTRQGVVRNVTDFGAFVDLGGVEGLIHVSEMSWQYVRHPSDVLAPGQPVDVYVMEVNREQKRIACSIKRLTSNPWHVAAEKLHAGALIDGVITSAVSFGVFVRVLDSIEGLVHVSELDGNLTLSRDELKEGQAIKVRVIDIDPNQQRLRLSLRLDNSPKNPRAVRPAYGAPSNLPPPPPPPEDPGYWDSLAQTGV